ncbi:putative type I restriction enzymeP M protein [Burkholderiales bacterium 8X]|nr:putative type I restriction enzymeP M protein [Burkholderiales bacterium 8X]
MTAPTVRQESLDRAAWAACDTFRGSVDPSDYKDPVLTMLFLKYVTDTWNDQLESYQRQYAAAEPGLIEELMANQRFVLPPEASFHALHAARYEPGNGERLDRALHALEDANRAKLNGVFQDISFNSGKLGETQQRNELLRYLLEHFARPELDLRPSRVVNMELVGNTFEHMIRQFALASGKRADEYYTPPDVSELMARLMDPQPNDEICDPTCGSGSLLLQCARLVRERTGRRFYALYGQEAIGSTWALAKMNLFMHGEDNHRLLWGDTIRNPKLLTPEGQLKRFDVVAANPPFSAERWGYERADRDPFHRFRRGLPPRTKGDYAFILHMLETLKPGKGRMAVVVPHGVLFRGAAEARIRRRLVDDNCIDAVIGLPEKLFYGTGIPATVIVFRSRKSDDKILFIDASRCFEAGKNQNRLRSSDIERIVSTCAARRSVDQFAWLASLHEIETNEFNLNISRYVQTAGQQESVDLVQLRSERAQLKQQLEDVENHLASCLRELGDDLGHA